MDNLTKQLADALRACLPHVDRARKVSGGDGDIAALNARGALRMFDAAQEAHQAGTADAPELAERAATQLRRRAWGKQ